MDKMLLFLDALVLYQLFYQSWKVAVVCPLMGVAVNVVDVTSSQVSRTPCGGDNQNLRCSSVISCWNMN